MAEESITENMTRAGKLLFNFAFPFAILGAYILIIYIIIPHEIFLTLMGLLAIYFIPPAGKESVIPLGISLGMPWWLIGTSVAMMDIVAATFMVLNFDLALKIPVLGDKWMKSFMEHGEEFFDSHRWIERFSSFGLLIFVVIPLQGTGGITTPIVGRMIGISRKNIMAAVIAGSLIGSYTIALGSEFVKILFLTDIRYGVAALAVLAAATGGGYLLYTRNKNRLKRKIP